MSSFSSLMKNCQEYKTLKDALKKKGLPVGVLGVSQAPKAHLIHSLCADLNRKALIVTPDEPSAVKFCDDLNMMGTKCLFYPARDYNYRPGDTQSKEYERKRIGVLGNIADGNYGAVVCSVEAAMQLTVPESILKKQTVTVVSGRELPQKDIISALIGAGYIRSDLVDGKGQFSQRGDIVDFFPPYADAPVRVEFWGDTVDTVAFYDAVTQRRGDSIDEIKITPSTEIFFESDEVLSQKIRTLAKSVRGKYAAAVKESLFADADSLDSGIRLSNTDRYLSLAYEKPETVFDYCINDLLFVSDSSNVKARMKNTENLNAEDVKMMVEDGILCKGLDNYIISSRRVFEYYEKMQTVYADNFARGSFDTPVKELVNMNVRQLSPWEGSLQVLFDDLKPDIAKGYKTVIAAGTPKAAASLCEDLSEQGIDCIYFSEMPTEFLAKSVNIIAGSISYGIDYPKEKIKIITQGRYKGGTVRKITEKKKKNANSIHSIEELHKGDYVVHSVHGIGLFDGIVNQKVSGVSKDYIKIKYRGSDILYVPITQLDLVSKYIGPGEETGSTVKLNRLGTDEWRKTKARVRSAVKDMAKELTELYAKRMNTKGFAFSPDIDMQSDFERRFEFDETDDQLRCIDEIKQDMEKPYPMDRLLCGDVGFGKTEVALRAAFKCIADGKQCVILVPTTILAFQHYRTILRRFEGFPVNIEMLSRFRKPKQVKEIIKKLKHGEIDIIVGTHRVISKDIELKDPGLVIIDEEQRFGVAQKEKLKASFPSVDILTLSATPIPRTLNMAMTGIRDMSVIEEAPLDRLPVQTYIIEHDMGIISEAIRKELRRGGQVYYLYNRVDNITQKAAEIKKYLPDVRIGIGHGKMTEAELSEVWRQLLDNEIDILVCTTIIETGVDVPNCNTLIIENADRLGLAQLHQIRGRVGRSSRRAYAYLSFVKGKELSEIAARRLDAIRQFTEFGSGFKIAMKDLEIRGAGSILGSQQHGHLEAVGYDMYLKLLSEAVSENGEEKKKNTFSSEECLVDIRMNAHIPESYIEAVPQRLSAYRRIAEVSSTSDAEDVIDEFIDRYGDIPESVRGLIKVSLIRNRAIDNNIYEIKQINDCILLYSNKIDADKVKKLAFAMRGRVLVNATAKPYISVKVPTAQNPIVTLTEIFKIWG